MTTGNPNSLEERLRKARLSPPSLPSDFSGQVMAEIARRELTVLPAPQLVGRLLRRWPELALHVAGVGLLLGAAILADALAYEVIRNGSLELLYFGTRFLGDFLSGLPLDLIVGSALLGTLAAGMFQGARLQGQRAQGAARMRVGVAWLLLICYGVTVGGGAALAVTGLNEPVQERLVEMMQTGPDVPWVGRYFRERAQFGLRHAPVLLGRVTTLGEGRVVLVTPDQREVPVLLPQGLKPRLEQHLRVRGRLVDGVFRADEGQFCEPAQAGRYFSHHQRMREMMDRGRHAMPGMGPAMESGMMPPHSPGKGPGMMRRGMPMENRIPGSETLPR